MLTTREFIEETEKMNKELAENTLLKWGFDRESAIKNIKAKYAQRPSESSYADLKVILEVLGELG